MAHDRFIEWRNGRRPTQAEISKVAKNLLGGVGKVGRWKDGRLIIDLPGTNTQPLKGLPGTPDSVNVGPGPRTYPPERWIEVWHDDGDPSDGDPPSTDVLTRHADEFTSGIADRIFDVLARWWGGKRDSDHKSRDELSAAVEGLERYVGARRDLDEAVAAGLLKLRELALGSKPRRCDEIARLAGDLIERIEAAPEAPKADADEDDNAG